MSPQKIRISLSVPLLPISLFLSPLFFLFFFLSSFLTKLCVSYWRTTWYVRYLPHQSLHFQWRFIIFKIQDQEVVVERLGNPDETYEDFTESLPANECRYAVYDFDFITDENCQKSKIFFIAWSPDTSKVRSKMVYASSKDRFKRELDGIQVELQATDPSEMSLDIIKGRAL